MVSIVRKVLIAPMDRLEIASLLIDTIVPTAYLGWSSQAQYEVYSYHVRTGLSWLLGKAEKHDQEGREAWFVLEMIEAAELELRYSIRSNWAAQALRYAWERGGSGVGISDSARRRIETFLENH